MAVAKVIEICSDSPKSFEDAIEGGIKQAGKTIKNLRGAWIKEQKVDIDGGKIASYKVNLMITFVVE